MPAGLRLSLANTHRFSSFFCPYLWELCIPIFSPPWYSFCISQSERAFDMTDNARNAGYRYFSFTYFYGKAYLGLAESVDV